MVTKKILIIDYDQSSLAALQGVFSKEGYKVITAADGQAGWDRYNKESPDLVLMEAMLPKVHGFELCQRITSERNSQATVFIMTGVYKDRVYRTEALRTYGASEYFEKPLKMTELLASVEAVLGKPETAPEPKPARTAKPEPEPAEPRKREKPRTDDDIFSLPADLDRLSREIPKVDFPKVRKPAPAPREAPVEAAFETLADELLKSVVVEPPAPKKAEGRPNGGNGNGHDGSDIDQFLKSALAGLEIDKEKVKVPKTAPLPPAPPPPPPPLEAKPRPTPPPPAPVKPKPTPPPPPAAERAETVAKNTLTAGDPGSDISPFFTPGKPRPEAPKETPRAQTPPAPPAVPAASPKAAKPADRPRPEPVRREPARPEPVVSEPAWRDAVKPEPVRVDTKIPEVVPTASGDIFRQREIFDHIGEDKPKKGFPMLAGVGIAVAAVAVAAFLVLRPKPAPKTDPDMRARRPAVEAPAPVQPVVEAPPPEIKPEPVQPKPKPQAKKAAPEEPIAEGILEPVAPSVAPLLAGDRTGGDGGGSRAAASSDPARAVPPPGTEAPPPAVKTEESAAPGPKTGTEAAADPGPAAVSAPAGPPVKEGDLVDLASVTSPPSIVRTINPVYPRLAEQLGVEGTITVNALIDEKGNVIDTGILKGIQDDKGLGKAAEAAVRKWKFEPARKDGVAVKVWKPFAISFKTGSGGDGASD